MKAYRNAKGQFHREDGPAYICRDGTEEWWFNGYLHRADGPAVIFPDGSHEWWLNGELHRTDGPAVICPDSTSEWWINGIQLSEDEITEQKMKMFFGKQVNLFTAG